ncbi:MAG: PEGA domain-containing protein [Candidatus Omnitrophica bacterium]|nr:PEGA domain-containing protein [Candidatus Omnitrophota bacterium]MBI2495537.1 PEGA domain-containing protein [Candidatus Omnitrophota bacterium]MBI3021658.1 PEGA domain-containing protein [Candidatus Omnitrophota bacterium]
MSVVCGLVLSGCLHRSLTIRTEPSGALVYLNDRLIGESPVAFDFEWYGWHRVMIRKSGFERIEDRKLLRAPAYLWIPFDLAMELAPFPVNDQRTWSYALTPMQPLPAPQPPPLTEPGNPPKAGGRGNPVAEGEGTTESTEESNDAAR